MVNSKEFVMRPTCFGYVQGAMPREVLGSNHLGGAVWGQGHYREDILQQGVELCCLHVLAFDRQA